MRVAMLSVHACPMAKLGGRDSGGMNVYVREIARDLARRGIEVDVFTRQREADHSSIQEIVPGARVIHIETGPLSYIPKMEVHDQIAEFTAHVEAFVAAERLRYDLIHSHYWLSAEVAEVLAERWRVPRVQMFHTLGLVKREVMAEDVDGESDVRVAIERRAVRGSQAVVAASDIEAAELRRLYAAAAEKIRIIPCGVDPEIFHPVRQADARRSLGRDQCERVVLFVGRIEQIKGIDVLLRAISLLFQGYPDLRSELRLLIVGGALNDDDDAPETDKIVELRRLVHEHRLEDTVDFVGSQDQHRLALFYAAADICAVPSLTESFGLVALESMACGTPVLGTRVGGLQTVIEDRVSGFLVPAGDEQALAEGMARLLLDHGLRTRLAAGARSRAQDYSWERVGDLVARLYDELVPVPMAVS
ncbi:MAG TPA: glycosyltransferase [Candidatus Limnocylindria bacterium]|jgi:D-inositol-3-phosphate glycosyltransferase